MVEKSINQIKSETFKALIGINLSKSLADDCSNLCCNLAKIKTPFLRDLITLLEKYKTKKINNSIDHKTSKDLIAPFYGLNLIEYLSSENINIFLVFSSLTSLSLSLSLLSPSSLSLQSLLL